MTEKHKRRWLRFSLRTLLVLVTILGVSLGWFTNAKRQSQYELQLAEELRAIGFRDVKLGGPYDSWELFVLNESQGWWRDTARRLLGERILWLVLEDPAGYSDITPLAGLSTLEFLFLPRTQVRDLEPLRKLTNMRHLELTGTPVNDLGPLARMTKLEDLQLSATQVSDLRPLAALTKLNGLNLGSTNASDIAPLANLKKLEYVDLSSTQVSDVSVLARLTALKRLNLHNTKVSDEQVHLLRVALPKCEIIYK